MLHDYQRSQEFLGLAERTRADYIAKINLIEKRFGDFPLSLLSDRRTRGEFMAWRDKLASSSRRQADYAWTVLARILSWARNRGLVASNPCEKGGPLYRSSRADKVWTADNEALFIARRRNTYTSRCCSPYGPGSGREIFCACHGRHTTAAASGCARARPAPASSIPVGAPLKAALDATPKRSTLILVSTDNQAVDRGRVPVELAQSLRRRRHHWADVP